MARVDEAGKGADGLPGGARDRRSCRGGARGGGIRAAIAAAALLGALAAGCRDRPATDEPPPVTVVQPGPMPGTAPGTSPGALSTIVGTIRSVEGDQLVLEVNGSVVPFSLDEGVTITRAGAPAGRDALREGEEVRAVYGPAPPGAPNQHRDLVRLDLTPSR